MTKIPKCPKCKKTDKVEGVGSWWRCTRCHTFYRPMR